MTPSKAVRDCYQKLLTKWKNLDYIHVFHNNGITLTGECLSKLYGLPKVYKRNNPLRPIVLTCNSPDEIIVNKLTSISTKHVPLPPTRILNSFDLK